MGIAFVNKPKGSIIGSGTYVFRHYGTETPTSYTISYTGLNSSDRYIKYKDSKYYGTGSRTIKAGDSIYLYSKATRNPGSQGIGSCTAYIRIRENSTANYITLASKTVQTQGTSIATAEATYTYTPVSNISISGSYSSGTFSSYVDMTKK